MARAAQKPQGDQRSLAKRMLKHLKVLTNWLGWKKTGSFISIVGLVFGFVFWLWPRSAPSNLQIIRNKGGPGDSRYLHGKSSGQIAGTAVILFNQDTAAKYGAVATRTGFKYTVSCNSHYSEMRRPGVYICILAWSGSRDVGNPCFGVGPKQVVCEMPAGFLAKFTVDNPTHIENYDSSLSAAAHFYPWRLKLANGLNCSWSWLEWRGQEHFHGGWICAKSTAGVTIAPGHNQHDYYGTDWSEINYMQLRDYQQAYYAEDLVQGEQNTWSVLLESPGNFGVFHRISVLQAWY